MAKVKVLIEDGDEEGHVNWTIKFKPQFRNDVDPATLTTAQRIGYEMVQAITRGEHWDRDEDEEDTSGF